MTGDKGPVREHRELSGQTGPGHLHSSDTTTQKTNFKRTCLFVSPLAHQKEEIRSLITTNVFPGLRKVPRPEEAREGVSRSGPSEGGGFTDKHLRHMEPTSLWRAGLPHPKGGGLPGATPPETLCPVRRPAGQDRPDLQVHLYLWNAAQLHQQVLMFQFGHIRQL